MTARFQRHANDAVLHKQLETCPAPKSLLVQNFDALTEAVTANPVPCIAILLAVAVLMATTFKRR